MMSNVLHSVSGLKYNYMYIKKFLKIIIQGKYHMYMNLSDAKYN